VVAVVLGFRVDRLWAPVALVGGFVAMLVTLARMLFGAESRRKRAGRPAAASSGRNWTRTVAGACATILDWG
jgi:hypothetical protein